MCTVEHAFACLCTGEAPTRFQLNNGLVQYPISEAKVYNLLAQVDLPLHAGKCLRVAGNQT